MNIAVIGTGYVGLVTGSCLSDLGHSVVCVDKDMDKVKTLSMGIMPIYEPGLEEIVTKNVKAGRLEFTNELERAVLASEVIFITVGTPSGMLGEANVSSVIEVAKELSVFVDAYKVIVNKSTVPVGSTKVVQKVIEETGGHKTEFDVVSNPEFLREGSAVSDFSHPDRIVIGANDERAAGIMTELYRGIRAPLVITDPASAEMIKYASNGFLATKVSFINAIANICEAVGADIREVALGMGYDHRIGFDFLKAGPGFGGSCFPKDCRALIKIAEDNGYDFQLLKGAISVNDDQWKNMLNKVIRHLKEPEGKTVAVLGLAFKPNTDDIRESPALFITNAMKEKGITVKVHDPVAMKNAMPDIPDAQPCETPYEACDGADLILIMTEWDEYKWLDYRKIIATMKSPLIVDTRNCLDFNILRRMGFIYEGVGR